MIDIRSDFKQLDWKPRPHSFGIELASDWADKSDDDPLFGLYKRCCYWSQNEIDILVACASQFIGKPSLDIGAATGWTSKHIHLATESRVDCIDPMFGHSEFWRRFADNTGFSKDWMYPITSDEFFDMLSGYHSDNPYGLICIDGDHGEEAVMRDAQNSAAHLAESGVILLHDTLGWPVQAAGNWLMDNGFKARLYITVHCVLVAWRGNFAPPDIPTDPRLLEHRLTDRMDRLDFERLAI
jgi:hypothetical protein